MSKNLIFCFDGTCNDPADANNFFEDGSISNVLKLHLLFGGNLQDKPKNNGEQRSFYYSGIGTHGGYLKQKFNAMFAPPYGDMRDILEKAQSDLDQNYQETDNLFIFGFSRGAAIARMFAARHINKKPVKLLGVFDTVAATKGSRDLNEGTFPASGILFEDGSVSEHVKKAVHLVAIDEKRIMFQPTLINTDKRVTEVWFAGVHSDIGGGYWFDGLSDITLDFMIRQAKDVGIDVLSEDKIDYANLLDADDKDEFKICVDDIAINPLPAGVLHEQHRSAIAQKTLAPRIVRVSENDKTSKSRLPIIHYSVCERFKTITGYRPYALRNTPFRVMQEDGTIEEAEYQGMKGLREWNLKRNQENAEAINIGNSHYL